MILLNEIRKHYMQEELTCIFNEQPDLPNYLWAPMKAADPRTLSLSSQFAMTVQSQITVQQVVTITTWTWTVFIKDVYLHALLFEALPFCQNLFSISAESKVRHFCSCCQMISTDLILRNSWQN